MTRSSEAILKTSSSKSYSKAVSLLKRGETVAFPTETVYGLGADALNSKAVCKIFEIKKRPSFDPLIVHVASIEQAVSLWSRVPEDAKLLMKRFWPGPLSIVLPKKQHVPDVVTSGLETVAVRMPDHPAALKLIKLFGKPVAAPSANLFGRTSPTTAQAVLEELGDSAKLILDGGKCRVGVESTVVKFERKKCVLLRPGGVSVEDLEKVLKDKIVFPGKKTRHDSPGLLKSHYAPRAPLILFDSLEEILDKLSSQKKDFLKRQKKWPVLAAIFYSKASRQGILFKKIQVLSLKKDPYTAASNLFQAIRKLDKLNPDFILAEKAPEAGIGRAINDRLDKASGANEAYKRFQKYF